jgi:hypothetical protein
MTQDQWIKVGLVAVGVVILIADFRVHYSHTLAALTNPAETEPPPPAVPAAGPRVDVDIGAVDGNDAATAVLGGVPEFLTQGW